MATKYGADALGPIGKMPTGQGPNDDELILKIIPAIPPPILLFYLPASSLPAAVLNI